MTRGSRECDPLVSGGSVKATLQLDGTAIRLGQLNAQRPDLPEERALVDAEVLGGCQPIPPVSLQGSKDHLLLGRFECRRWLAWQNLDFHRRLQLIGQMARLYHPTRAQREGMLDDVLQLAHIPRIIMRRQNSQCLVGHSVYVLHAELVEAVDEVLNKKRDVLLAVAQWG